ARAGRHGPLARPEKLFDVREHGGVLTQLAPQQLSNLVSSAIVAGRSQPAGDDEQAGHSQRLADGLLDGRAGVGHRHLTVQRVAEVGQLAAEPLLMRIEHLAQHQFSAGVDELNAHGPPSLLSAKERAKGKVRACFEIQIPKEPSTQRPEVPKASLGSLGLWVFGYLNFKSRFETGVGVPKTVAGPASRVDRKSVV